MTSDPVRVTNYLEAADTLSTLAAVQALGAIVERREDELMIRGPGLRAAAQPTGVIDVGNAGTLLRLLPGWLAGPARGRVDPRRRRVDPAPAGRPHRRRRCGRWARSSTRARAASRR